ncbi:MAG: histone deacetylase family protein, partial [Pirellulales bacterium]|nr:histone deacetylase family protein [Pirellulales bacterium]
TGYYITTNSAPIVEGTFAAAVASAQVAVHAAELVRDGASHAYALCRPPGHHAFSDTAGGFCYLNNVAIAAQYLRRSVDRVAILDFDVHHGNGTQGIFYDRPDVFFASLHGDPAQYFPYFAGYAHEAGSGPGEGFTLNLPQQRDTADAAFLEEIDRALDAVRLFAPDVFLISAGFDAYEADPIGFLKISTAGFGEIGRRIGAQGYPTVLVQEGGYNCDALGANLSAFLAGFENARS